LGAEYGFPALCRGRLETLGKKIIRGPLLGTLGTDHSFHTEPKGIPQQNMARHQAATRWKTRIRDPKTLRQTVDES